MAEAVSVLKPKELDELEAFAAHSNGPSGDEQAASQP